MGKNEPGILLKKPLKKESLKENHVNNAEQMALFQMEDMKYKPTTKIITNLLTLDGSVKDATMNGINAIKQRKLKWNPPQEELTFLQAGSRNRVSPLVLPGSNEAKKMTVSSGRKCSALLRKPNHVGSLLKMCLESSIWHSMTCLLRWKVKATRQGRVLFQLVPLTPRIEEIESGLLPTPRASDAIRIKFSRGHTLKSQFGGNVHSVNFITQRDYHTRQTPELTEAMMGFPIGWTDLEA